MRASISTIVLTLSMSLAGLAVAGTGSTDSTAAPTKSSNGQAATQASLTSGEVRKVDLEQGKVTLKHERIENLDMPPMTMVFKASDPQLLKSVKTGDKVQFRAESNGGAIVITELKPAS